MDNVFQWINTHGALCTAIMWFLSQAAATMPTPKPGASAWWVWLYSLVQMVLANAEKSHIRLTVAAPGAATNSPAPADPSFPGPQVWPTLPSGTAIRYVGTPEPPVIPPLVPPSGTAVNKVPVTPAGPSAQ